MTPKVSVLMSVYNRQDFVGEAIESILNQTFTDFEFLIVDDASTDQTLDIIKSYQQQDKRIKLIELNQNMGLAHALNLGIKQATGTYIARMDSDDISLPERFGLQVEFLGASSDVGVVGTQMQVVNQAKEPLFDFIVPQEHSLIVWNLFFGRTFAHPSVMMRRDILVDVNGYDESIPVAQDVDLWSRLVGRVQFANLPQNLMLYRTHNKATSVSKAQQQKNVLFDTAKRLLIKLWGDVSDDVVNDLLKVRSGQSRFTMEELEHMSVLMTRLNLSMLDAGWLRQDELPLIVEEMKRRLQFAEPRKKKFWEYFLKRDG